MTTTDTWLEEQSKAMNGEAYVIAGYLAVATTVVTGINTTDTALEGEIGTRVALTGSPSAYFFIEARPPFLN